jgi:hypothetical protein
MDSFCYTYISFSDTFCTTTSSPHISSILEITPTFRITYSPIFPKNQPHHTYEQLVISHLSLSTKRHSSTPPQILLPNLLTPLPILTPLTSTMTHSPLLLSLLQMKGTTIQPLKIFPPLSLLHLIQTNSLLMFKNSSLLIFHTTIILTQLPPPTMHTFLILPSPLNTCSPLLSIKCEKALLLAHLQTLLMPLHYTLITIIIPTISFTPILMILMISSA